MALILWALPVLGATLIVTCSSLFKPLREWFQFVRGEALFETTGLRAWIGRLLVCPMCVGFWVGAGGWFINPLTPDPFRDGCAASFICWASHVCLCALGQGKLIK